MGGGSSLIALANVANRQGRRVADHICGLPTRSTPSLGTAIVKVFDLTAATTGWNEKRLRAAGRKYRAIHSHPMSHAGYYPGAQPMSLKLLFDPDDGTILGAQAVGREGVDKRIDVIATAITGGITADELADLELAYAPPFSSAKDPVNMLGYMAENVRTGACDVVEYDELAIPDRSGLDAGSTFGPTRSTRGARSPARSTSPSTSCARRLDGARGPLRRLLRGRPAGTHRDGAPPRTRDRGTKFRRWLPNMGSGGRRP